jgi:hypothetical protein
MKFDVKKFLSRKFLIAVVGVIVGLAISFGADSSEITQIAGAVTSAISALSYIFGEAMVDAAAAKKPEVITETEQTEDKTVYY